MTVYREGDAEAVWLDEFHHREFKPQLNKLYSFQGKRYPEGAFAFEPATAHAHCCECALQGSAACVPTDCRGDASFPYGKNGALAREYELNEATGEYELVVRDRSPAEKKPERKPGESAPNEKFERWESALKERYGELRNTLDQIDQMKENIKALKATASQPQQEINRIVATGSNEYRSDMPLLELDE